MRIEDDYMTMKLNIKGKNAVEMTEKIMKAIQEAEKDIDKFAKMKSKKGKKEKKAWKREIACLFHNCKEDDLELVGDYDLFQKEYFCKRCGRRYAIAISGYRIILEHKKFKK